MKALWWFEPNAIAGMARPGFNAVHWGELSLAEGILLSWLGQYSDGPAPLAGFREHLRTYAPRVIGFFGLDAIAGAQALRVFDDAAGTFDVLERLARRTQALRDISIEADHVRFAVHERRLLSEVAQLKELGIGRIVSLTERHHHKEFLADHFAVHHLGIDDLGAPTDVQVLALAEVIRAAQRERQLLAVHCLAGIGRTSTMLLAAHLAMGRPLGELKRQIAQRNPAFLLTGEQAAFIERLARIGLYDERLG